MSNNPPPKGVQPVKAEPKFGQPSIKVKQSHG